ncbi:hypothetical protein LTS15_005700 [Exophiala xenobiotica]|nr:hypothetical protein LTS15_005700 [Exophiala xenobiotica]
MGTCRYTEIPESRNTIGSELTLPHEPAIVITRLARSNLGGKPPAVPLIHDATNNPNLLLLTYDVTYWNSSSGWEDTFGSFQWDARQRQYVTKWVRNGLFTPQIVVDGASDSVCSTKDEINQIIAQAMETRNGMTWAMGIDRVGDELRLAFELPEADIVYDVVVVTYDPALHTVKVRKGPNKGEHVVSEYSEGIDEVRGVARRDRVTAVAHREELWL